VTRYEGPRSPTPKLVYEINLWQVRIFTTDNNRVGVPVMFKAPYSIYMNALGVLGRAMARGQITRITFGPIPRANIRAWDRADKAAGLKSATGWRSHLERYEDAFERISGELDIDWAA
jgi:hypothetical protein